MITNNTPLRYRISDLRQLSGCLSNNSRDLSISITTFVNDDRLNGLRLSVDHKQYGSLFSYVIGAKGRIITTYGDEMIPELTVDQILLELMKYGFYVEYIPVDNLPGNQLKYLVTLNELGFDKLRLMNVWKLDKTGLKEFSTQVIVFNSTGHEQWLNAGYSASQDEFNRALNDGSCINVTGVSKTRNFDWSWLHNRVMNIEDILADNSGGF